MICVNSIALSRSSITMKPNAWYYDLHAYVYPSDATCSEVVWHSSNPEVASVGYSNGYICSKSNGTTTIYASATDGSGVSSSCTVYVSDTVYVDEITLEKTTLTLEKDTCSTLSATVCPSNASNKVLVWGSSNESVAVVNNGTVCGISAGEAIITAFATDGSDVTASCSVSVTEDVLVKLVKLRYNDLVMHVGEEKYIDYRVRPSDASQEVVWSSSDPSIATVNVDSGRITAKKVGNVAIYVKAIDGSECADFCCVSVIEDVVKIDSIEITAEKQSLSVGESMALNVTICPSDATNKDLTWSSSNESVVSVSDGTVYAEGPGEATITATAVDDSGVSGTYTVTVNRPTSLKELRINSSDGGNMPIRSEPSDTSDIEDYIANHTMVDLIEAEPQNTKWYKIYGQTTSASYVVGWCSGEYLEEEKIMLEVEFADGMFLRSAPLPSSDVWIESLFAGTLLLLLEKDKIYNEGHYYYKVRYQNTDGYVTADDDSYFTTHNTWLPLITNSGNTTEYIGDYKEFLDVLGYYESSNEYNIEKNSYLGRYMMGTLALQEAGFHDSNKNWTKLAAKYGVYSNEDFLSNSEAQDIAVKLCHKKIWTYLDDFSAEKLGQVYQNVIITESGLLAGAHLVGAFDLMQAIKKGEIVVDGNNKPAHEYMASMANYDISQIK